MDRWVEHLEQRRLLAAQIPGQIECEDFDAGLEGVAYHDTETANLGGNAYRPGAGVDLQTINDGGTGRAVAFAKAGEWIKYTINVADAGSYALDLRVADQGTGGKVRLEIDGINVTGSLTIPSTGGWDKWQTLSKSGVNLSAGQHVARLVMETNGFAGYTGNFNWIKFTRTAAPPPPAPAQGPYKQIVLAGTATSFEAEDFDVGGQGMAFSDSESANRGNKSYRPDTGVDFQSIADGGSGIAVGYVKAGEWLEYTITAATAGTYAIEVRLAALGAGGRFHFDLDGARATSDLLVPSTGNWNSYTTITTSGIAMSVGTHVLRLSFDGNGSSGYVGDFNWLRAAPVTPTMAAPKAILPGLYADPTIAYFDGTYYIYPTTDGYDGWNSTYFTVWSSKDLVNWSNNGIIFDLTKDTWWAKTRAWAPSIATKNGKYYLYFAGDSQIGVAVADSPTGPFKDAIGKPLINKGAYDSQVIDPMVFVDDDGSAFLYFGQRNCNVVKLNPDMVSFDPAAVKKITPPGYNEGPFMIKRQGKYYLMWSEYDTRDPRYSVAYAVSDSPTGPFIKPAANPILSGQGIIQGAGHHSVVQIPGTDQWLIAYHRFAIPGGDGYHRETCLAPLRFDDQGWIKTVDVYATVAPLSN